MVVDLIADICVRGFGYLIGRAFSSLFGEKMYRSIIIRRTPKRTKKWIKQYFKDHLSDSETADEYKDYLLRWLQAHNLSEEDLKSGKIEKTLLKLVKSTKTSKKIKNLLQETEKPLKNAHSFQRWDDLIEGLLNFEFKYIFLFKDHTENDIRIFEGIKEIVKHSYLHNLKQEKVMINTYLIVEHHFNVAESQKMSIIDKLDSDIEDNLIDIMNEQQELNIIADTINQMLTTYIKDSVERQKILDDIFGNIYNMSYNLVQIKQELIESKQRDLEVKDDITEMKGDLQYLVEKAEEKPSPKEKLIEMPFTFKHFSKPINLPHIEELMKLENKFEFLENRLCGKFVTQTEEKSLDWNSLKEHDILDFSWVEFPDIEDENIPLYIITGKGGVGKTTYLVYWLEKCLLSDESWIKNVIFLNPTKETFFHKEEIFEELQFFTKGTPINPDNLIIAIDALYRKNDNDQDLKEKFKVIKEIINNDYKVILTIKDIHLKKLENEVPDGYNIWKHELTPTIESTKLILRNWMKFYEVKSSFQEENLELENKAITLLFEKSEKGLPYYIHHFVIMMFSEDLSFSEEIVKVVPEGMKNFIWYTIEKELTLQDNDITYFILRMLYKQRNALPFSFEFLKYLTEWHTLYLSKIREESLSKLITLKLYLLKIEFKELDIGEGESKKEVKKKDIDIIKYSLDDVWRDCFETRKVDKDNLARDFISFEKFNKIKESFEGIKADFVNHLRDFITLSLEKQDNPEILPLLAYLLADLAKFDGEQIVYCLKLFEKYRAIIPWSYNCRTYIEHELALASFLRAIEYRKEGDYISAEKLAESATNLVQFKKGLHLYAQILVRKLVETPKEKREVLISKIDDLYKRIIKINEEDAISWYTRAIFCKNIQEFKKAEEYFEKALKLKESKYVPALQSYAIFCGEMGNLYWNIDRDKADKYFDRAKELFESGKILAAQTKFSQRELLNAYAKFLSDLAVKRVNYELDELADEIWCYLIENFNEAIDINGYANFLMKNGWTLEKKYPNKSYFAKAKEKLEESIKVHDHPNSYNILARLLCQYELENFEKYSDREKIFNDAIGLLENSIEKGFTQKKHQFKFPLNHEAACNHEKGKIYMEWAKERPEKVQLAIDHLNAALLIPDNIQNYKHKMKVYHTFSMLYSTYKHDLVRAQQYALKADECARKIQWNNNTHYKILLKMGDQSSYQDAKTAIYFYERASEILKDNYIPIIKIGQCYSNLAFIENYRENMQKAIDYYSKGAELGKANNRILRDVRRNIKRNLEPKLDYTKEAYLFMYLKIMKNISEMVFINGPDISWNMGEDYFSYSEDFINLGRVLSYDSPKEAREWFNSAPKVLPELEEKIIGLFDEDRLFDGSGVTKKKMREKIEESHKIETLCSSWVNQLDRIIKEEKTNSLHHYLKILKFDYETCLYFSNLENARKILKDYFNVIFPLKLLNDKELRKLGKKFLKLREFHYAYKCFKYLKQKNSLPSKSLKLLAESSMRIGLFEESIGLYREILEKHSDLVNENKINDMINKCHGAIAVQNEISEALTLILDLIRIEIFMIRNKIPFEQTLANAYHHVAKDILEIKRQINLMPLISLIADKRVYFIDADYLKMIVFPNKIIRYLLWKAQEMGYPLSEDEEDFLSQADYKREETIVLLYSLIQIRKEMENVGNLVKNAKYIQAAFYHFTYLALNTLEQQENDFDLSIRWGQTGGALNNDYERFPMKISDSIIKKCFNQSLNLNEENERSRAHYGLHILRREKNIKEAKEIFEKCENRDKNLLIGLAEIAESENNFEIARNCYVEAKEYIEDLVGDNDYKVKELTPLAERLLMLGYPNDALEIYKFIETIVQGRENLLAKIKIELIKKSYPKLIA